MFGNKNESEIPNPNGKGMIISNRINQGTTFSGELESDGDVRVEGVIKGTVRTLAKVAIGASGLVNGDIICKNADIEGKVNGDLEVGELLTLKSTCIVEGNIYTNKIVIESGARFNGICTMGSKDKKGNATEAIKAIIEPEKAAVR
ncbi:MAG: polymer-forming cytoskeletal protein [Bacteroidetes bacterium]|nr:polymer-forming cytoskeletal protein [Bacteroidota bacterium]MBP7397974.1 polymer-forming cytoskeletal protein [Chitinophagales bacterium]MBK7108931.1 polymer-forming cytoskeletal protein [Bacteroidota bacterium]MBK8488742.1 polymer-forming cytoskeletal protein [Bacteroidota bacterium]MBK8681501.1 polymer-forming cytoskeletal protein [Bacteroidota bacterium]